MNVNTGELYLYGSEKLHAALVAKPLLTDLLEPVTHEEYTSLMDVEPPSDRLATETGQAVVARHKSKLWLPK